MFPSAKLLNVIAKLSTTTVESVRIARRFVNLLTSLVKLYELTAKSYIPWPTGLSQWLNRIDYFLKLVPVVLGFRTYPFVRNVVWNKYYTYSVVHRSYAQYMSIDLVFQKKKRMISNKSVVLQNQIDAKSFQLKRQMLDLELTTG